MICIVKSSFILDQGPGKDKIVLPAGTKLMFLDTTHHFYHAYYESHNYTGLFHFKGQPLEFKFHRVHGSANFQLMSCSYSHDQTKKLYWKDAFEGDCPLSVN